MKRGDLSINYIFLIFIATIAAFVILALVTKWSVDARGFVGKLFPKEDVISDIRRVDIKDCNILQNEVIKHAKLCYTKAKEGYVKGNLCYALKSQGCTVNSAAIQNDLTVSNMNNIVASNLGDNIIIGFDYGLEQVEVD